MRIEQLGQNPQIRHPNLGIEHKRESMEATHHSVTLGSAASVQAFTARNLQLLQAIESTLTHLDSDTDLLNAVGRGFDEIFASLKARANGEMIDGEGATCAALSNASDACSRMYANATKRHKAACADKRLQADDGVVEAFESYMEALRGLHDLIEEIKDWIETHDALLEPATGASYATAEDLFAALDAD